MATPRTPQEAQAAQGLAALRQARIDRAQARARAQALQPCSLETVAGMAQAIRQAQGLPPRVRPLLPGEALPPEPLAQAGPAPELPPVPTPWHRLTPGQAEAAWHAMLTRTVARQAQA